MSTDMEKDFRQKLVEESQVDIFYKCAGFLASVNQIFKSVEKSLLTYSKDPTPGSIIVKVKLIKSCKNLLV